MARDVYKAIMIAAANDRGLHLTADEVWNLSGDDAVSSRASNTLTFGEFRNLTEGLDFWKDASPKILGEPYNGKLDETDRGRQALAQQERK